MTSKAFTASSDRIEAARKALTDLRTAIDGPHPADNGLDSFTLAHVSAVLDEMEPTLRALITPPAVGEMPDLEDLYARAHQRALPSDSGPFTVLDLDQADAAGKLAIFRAGIQAAHAAWGQTIEKEENR